MGIKSPIQWLGNQRNIKNHVEYSPPALAAFPNQLALFQAAYSSYESLRFLEPSFTRNNEISNKK